MSHADKTTTPADDDLREQRLFELLDHYVESLHRDDAPSRSVLLERNPDLQGLLACLESLDALAAPPLADDEAHGGPALAPTVIVDEAGVAIPPVVPPPEERREFGKYELLRELGRGGMGVVYEAVQKDLGRTVALKMILSSQLASAEEVRRFHAEARAAAGLRHPNIVGIHEVGQIDGQHYFTMDYIPGQSLAELLRGGPVDPDRAAGCLAAVARAVNYLHGHRIIHRDLKPSNILLDASGTPYLTDFGLAKVFSADSERTRTGTIVGTPSYMAPEQAASRSDDISPATDVYSLGAILYELLTGRPPFRQDNPLDTLVEVLEGEPTLPTRLNRRVPRELELICLRCLEKDPRRRYASAAELADDLERYLCREPVAARPSGLWPRFRRWARREPALVSHLAALLAASVIVQVRYQLVGTDFDYHLRIMSVLGGWALASFVFQRMLHREDLADAARFGWAAADAGLLTLALLIVDAPHGPLLIGYPLLVAASGLFFRVRLVWFMTGCCLLAYTSLAWLRADEAVPPHYPLIFVAVLGVLGFIIAYQVQRVRALSRYYEHRRLP